jgi:hypothetical protein
MKLTDSDTTSNPISETQTRLHAVVHGRVQGVSFR